MSVIDISEFVPFVAFYRIISEVVVGESKWYSVRISPEVYNWLNTQDTELWSVADISQSIYVVHEELLVMMKLRFPNESFSNSWI